MPDIDAMNIHAAIYTRNRQQRNFGRAGAL
jgi:hypothetical protein